MKLILGGINGEYLQNITLNAAPYTEEVLAAVAYANKSSLLFDWCWNNKIPLKFWGRLDDTVAVKTNILLDFLKRKSPEYVCKLVEYHHAKVIWWRGYGLYIGSANLTDSAWYKNVEAGCFFYEHEINDVIASDIHTLFSTLDEQATPLTDELYNLLLDRSKKISDFCPNADEFWSNSSLKRWSGLVTTEPKKAKDRKKDNFLEEWYSTLQDIRSIGEIVSREENRPKWIPAHAPIGIQAYQFLHAHYAMRTFNGRKANYEAFYQKNKNRKTEALNETIEWWRQLPEAPDNEEEIFHVKAPLLKGLLEKERIKNINYEEFEVICNNIHAIRERSRQVPNVSVSLPDIGVVYSMDTKIKALSQTMWSTHSGNGSTINEVLFFVLYGGAIEKVPERLWLAVHGSKWGIENLGISGLGEIIGWALPETFPPRNDRTSKALKSLGYGVKIYTK